MRLVRFRVSEFRSVKDSGWIDTDDICGLIGANESGKTNLLIPLWKFNPAEGGEINPKDDYQRKYYSQVKKAEDKPVFIKTVFELNPEEIEVIEKIIGGKLDGLVEANISRNFDGLYSVGFNPFEFDNAIYKQDVLTFVNKAFVKLNIDINDEKQHNLEGLKIFINGLKTKKVDPDNLRQLEELDLEQIKTQTNIDLAKEIKKQLNKSKVSCLPELLLARKKIIELMPKFVYYSNYGNLDSEIYLPHVIDNLDRLEELGAKETEKSRTLKVLFDFVGLLPEEILDLGQDVDRRNPSADEIAEVTENKREREILLQSASAKLTDEFRDWWKQGNYKFRFQADGDHFRIWVSDQVRTEEIELESRSTGLQWFFSFYLVFLVESSNNHENTVLLLDEPGLSLHPLAQKDLTNFFKSLSKTNQIVFTTHSPFLVDSDHLDQMKAVYVDDKGFTVASPDLRSGLTGDSRKKSIYPVHAALGLTVSDILLEGCLPIIVEGPSDQHYLTAIKIYLISKGKFKPKLEVLFLPAGGTKGIKAVTPVISSTSNELPVIFVDSDEPGRTLRKHLLSGLYQGETDKIISIGDFIHISDAEVEDLFPGEWLADLVSRILKGPEEDFIDSYIPGKNIITQIEKWADENNYPLEKGWKVELAKKAKAKLGKGGKIIPDDLLDIWKDLFSKLLM